MNIKTEPLENIRVEVVKPIRVITGENGEVSQWIDEKTGLKVRLSSNLDNYTDADGNTQYLRSGQQPRKGIVEHRGITQLKTGEFAGWYVITQEILKDGEKRRNSKRRAILVTDAEALDYIIFADRMDILERPRFFPLKALFYGYTLEPKGEGVPDEVEKHFWEV